MFKKVEVRISRVKLVEAGSRTDLDGLGLGLSFHDELQAAGKRQFDSQGGQCWTGGTLPYLPLGLGQPLQSVLLCFRRLLDLGLQFLLLADDLLLLQSDLLRALHHLNLHLLLFNALLGFGHLVTKRRGRHIEAAGISSSSRQGGRRLHRPMKSGDCTCS